MIAAGLTGSAELVRHAITNPVVFIGTLRFLACACPGTSAVSRCCLTQPLQQLHSPRLVGNNKAFFAATGGGLAARSGSSSRTYRMLTRIIAAGDESDQSPASS